MELCFEYGGYSTKSQFYVLRIFKQQEKACLKNLALKRKI